MSDNEGELATGDPVAERLYIAVARRILELVERRGIVAGERLPGEVDLSTALEVSRATVREALVALEMSGAVVIKRHAGAFLRDPGMRVSPDGLPETALPDVDPLVQIEARRGIEPYSARLAAMRRTDKHCLTMDVAIREMVRENKAGFATERGDRAFHVAIAEASGNVLVLQSVTALWALRENGKLWIDLQEDVDIERWRTEAVFEHMRILDAIRRADADSAEATMIAHLDSVRQSIEEAFRTRERRRAEG